MAGIRVFARGPAACRFRPAESLVSCTHGIHIPPRVSARDSGRKGEEGRTEPDSYIEMVDLGAPRAARSRARAARLLSSTAARTQFDLGTGHCSSGSVFHNGVGRA